VLTGLRIGEILALRWRDVDFSSGEIRVEQACYRGLIGTPKTKGSRRTLPMPESLKGESQAPQREIGIGRASGFSNPQWHPVQRYHPAAQISETGRTEARDALAQLAYSAPHSRHALAARGSNAPRGTSAVGPLQNVNHPRNLHAIHSRKAQRKAVENLSDLVTNGDELGQRGGKLPLATERIQ